MTSPPLTHHQSSQTHLVHPTAAVYSTFCWTHAARISTERTALPSTCCRSFTWSTQLQHRDCNDDKKLTASDHYEVIHFNVTSVVVVDKHSTLFTVYNTRTTTFSHPWFLERRHTRQPTLLRLCSSFLPTKPCDTASQQLRACEATSASNVYAWARTCQWWGAIAKNADEHNHEDT